MSHIKLKNIMKTIEAISAEIEAITKEGNELKKTLGLLALKKSLAKMKYIKS